MTRIFTSATILSAVLLATQFAVGVWAISPQSRQSVFVCDGFWFSLWGSDEAIHEGESLGVYYWYLPLGNDESVWTVREHREGALGVSKYDR